MLAPDPLNTMYPNTPSGVESTSEISVASTELFAVGVRATITDGVTEVYSFSNQINSRMQE